jgi:hypothetical protein
MCKNNGSDSTQKNIEMYKSGLIFIYIGAYSRLLIGMSFFKDGDGIETVYCDRNINISEFILGFTFFEKKDYHAFGEGYWSNMQEHSNNLIQFSKLQPIALTGKESKSDFEDILHALI